MTDVVVAAASPALRAGLRVLLADTGADVVGEVAALAEIGWETGPFDVLLVADEGLLADADDLWDELDAPALVLLSDDAAQPSLLRALPLRGWAVLPLDATAEELGAAIETAAHGLVVLSVPLAEQLIHPRPGLDPEDGPLDPLTAREGEVLALLGQGLSNKLIARELGISEHTVKFHVSSIFSKLGAASRTDAVSRGARYGLIVL